MRHLLYARGIGIILLHLYIVSREDRFDPPVLSLENSSDTFIVMTWM